MGNQTYHGKDNVVCVSIKKKQHSRTALNQLIKRLIQQICIIFLDSNSKKQLPNI